MTRHRRSPQTAARSPSRPAASPKPAGSAGARPATAWPWPTLPWAGVLGLVLAAALWLQARVVSAPFFADDFVFLDQVRHRSLPGVLAGPDPIGNFVRPIGRQLYFWLLTRVGGETAWVFHAANLALFVGALALLFVVVRRLAGTVAAAIATAFVALHYAADVPLVWASGSQDLLALVGALAALALFLAGRRWPAAVVFLVALLSKETVLFLPLVAALAARRAGEPWRRSLARAWPLGLAALAWSLLWLAVAARHPSARQAVAWSAGGIVAVVVHLAQVAVGGEWRRGGELRFLSALPALVPLGLAALAVALAGWGKRSEPGAARPALSPVALGITWAVLGMVPITAVATTWSAYYYLFALCGLGLALGAALAPRSRALALVVLVLLAWGSENGRRLDEFITAPGAWTTQSHVNRYYVERGASLSHRYLEQLRRLHPTLPPRSTLFFGGLPGFIAFQTADGPLLRWAYRDSSLRSYFLMQFSAERYRRGPALAFVVRNDTLEELALDSSLLQSFAMTAMISGHPQVAMDLLGLPAMWGADSSAAPYWRAWPRLALGDTAGARHDLQRMKMTLDAGPTPELPAAMNLVVAGDTAAALQMMVHAVPRHVLDADAHSVLGALLERQPGSELSAGVEAAAATTLAPRAARHWWLMAVLQIKSQRYEDAHQSLERFFELGGEDPQTTMEARRLRDWLDARSAGGAKVQEALREGPGLPR
jgi:hypothetical protein